MGLQGTQLEDVGAASGGTQPSLAFPVLSALAALVSTSGPHVSHCRAVEVAGYWRYSAPQTVDGFKCQLKRTVSFSFASMKGNRRASFCNCSMSFVKVIFYGRSPVMILLVNLCFGLYVMWSLVTWSRFSPNISVFSFIITFVFFVMLKIDVGHEKKWQTKPQWIRITYAQ